MKKIIVITAILLYSSAFGQPSNNSTQQSPQFQQQNQSDPNETVLKYEQFLRDETEKHREYVQEYYDLIIKLLSGLSVVFIGVFTWLNWRSKSEIKKQVNEQFKENAQNLIDEKLKQIDNIIKENKEKSSKQFENINSLILELSAKSDLIKVSEDKKLEKEEEPDVNMLKGKKILWVDDHPENNDYPRRILEQAGIKFTLAFDTQLAMNIIEKNKFDLIISDMGRGNNPSAGLDLLNELKKKKLLTPVVIYASSDALNNYGTQALNLGAIAITTGVSRILNIVQRVLLVK